MSKSVNARSVVWSIRWSLRCAVSGVMILTASSLATSTLSSKAAWAETPADAEIRNEAEGIVARDGAGPGTDPGREPQMQAVEASAGAGSVFNPSVDFRSYKRFAFSDRPKDDLAEGAPGQDVGNPFLIQEIQRVVNTEMINRGYYPAPATEADFLVSLQVSGSSRAGYFIDHVRYSADYHQMYSAWGGYGRVLMVPTTFQKGTLVVDIIDIGLKELSWQGWSTEPIGYLKDRAEIIQKVVKDIIDRFPPNG
jgi:hypothetical protein